MARMNIRRVIVSHLPSLSALHGLTLDPEDGQQNDQGDYGGGDMGGGDMGGGDMGGGDF